MINWKTLPNKEAITVMVYRKGSCIKLKGCLPPMDVKSIDGENVTCTIGGTINQVVTRAGAFIYINDGEGYY